MSKVPNVTSIKIIAGKTKVPHKTISLADTAGSANASQRNIKPCIKLYIRCECKHSGCL